MTTTELAAAVHRLTGEVRSMRMELDQLRDELGEVRTALYQEGTSRREAVKALHDELNHELKGALG